VISLDSLSAEAELARQPGRGETPEAAYNRKWARITVDAALHALRGQWTSRRISRGPWMQPLDTSPIASDRFKRAAAVVLQSPERCLLR
jgi:hypothetical protein